jgi:hypothetical protein
MSKRRLHLLFVVTAAVVLSALAFAGSPAARAADQIPPQLAGQWAIPWQGGTEYLTLADSRFMFFFNLLCTNSRPTAVDASTGRLVLAA